MATDFARNQTARSCCICNEEHGLDCLHLLRGEFAFAVWYSSARQIIAARDRFGVKPVVYAESPRGLILASKSAALFEVGVSSAWDPESFYHASSLQYVLPDRTLFANIRQLPPGCVLLANERGLRVQPYWDIPYRCPQQRPVKAQDRQQLVEECQRRVVDAVHVRLRSDVPICFHLSGGLDSSAVVGVASSLMGKPVDAYAVTSRPAAL